MIRVGLITIYTEPNYGSALQAYATQMLINSMGYECKIIKYKYPNEWNHEQGYPRSNFMRTFLKNLGLKKYHRKANKLKRFIKKHFSLTQEFKNLEALKAYDWKKNFDIVAVGSDQVWNYRYLYGDSAFMLSFLPDGFKRISIASSFACKEITEKYISKYVKNLSKFQALSVREKNGLNILKNQLNFPHDVKVILDPTLLLSKEQWLSVIKEKEPSAVKNKKYILLYGLYYAFEPRPYIFDVIKYFKKKYNCEVVALEGYTSADRANGLEMINCTDSSLYEFMYLFNHAEMVVTSSFHGTAFGLNFGKPLISIVPDNGIDDRLSSLLNMVGACSCAVEMGTPITSIEPGYNFREALTQLSELRDDSVAWISESLK